jgi:replicative DNA helicase
MSAEFEMRLLGAVIQEPALLDGERVTAQLFDMPRHRTLFSILAGMRAADKPISLLTLAAELGDGRLAEVGGPSYLASLTSADTTANADFYMRELREAADRRAMQRLAKEILSAGDRTPVEALLSTAESTVFEVRARGSDSATIEPREALHAVIEKIEKRMRENAEGPSGVQSGFPQLDGMTGGFQASDLVLLAARTSVGKSSLALSFIERQVRKGIRVALASIETPATQIYERLLAMRTGINSGRMRFGHLTSDELGQMMSAASVLYDASLRILDKPSLSISGLRSWAHGEAARGAQILYLDYCGLLNGGDERAPRWERMSMVSQGLKTIARELSLPVVALAQLNREAADSQTPGLHHLRDSGSFEQDADVILLLQRSDMESAEERVPATLRIAKHRNGPTGKIDLVFHRLTTQFSEAIH